MRQSKSGFTLVELLIVIVVIAILAAISVVTYSGVQDRARNSAVTSELATNLKQVQLYQATYGSMPSLAEISSGANSFTFNESAYRTINYCVGDTDAGFGVELTNSDRYFQTTATAIAQDNDADIDSACADAGVTLANGDPATTEYVLGQPATWAHCADENQTCSFSGTKDVRYGADTRWVTQTNVTGSIQCRNSVFGDPAPGTIKSCEYR